MKHIVSSYGLLTILTACFAMHLNADNTANTNTANRIIATIPVGQTPAGIAITPNGQFAYVANNNNNSVPNGDSVSVINLATNTVVTTIHDASFMQPYTITINAAGTLAYVTNSNSTTVTIINLATNTVSGIIGGFDGPSGFAILPSQATAYVSNYGGPDGVGSGNGNTIRVVNLSTNSIVGSPITVGLAPAALAVSPNGAFLYSINYVTGEPGTGTMNIINTTNNTVTTTVTGFSGPFGIAVTPNGFYAYVTNFGSNNFSPVGTTVSVVNLSTYSISATIQVGTQPSGVAITPDGHFVYITNYNTLYLGPNFTDFTPGPGTVNIINTYNNAVMCPVFTVGSSPADIAITPDGTRAYVTNYSSNDVTVLNIADCMWLNVRKKACK